MMRHAKRGWLLPALSLTLVACSFAPLPIRVDLLAGGDLPGTSGNFELVTPGTSLDLTPYLGASRTGTLGPFSAPVAGVNIDVLQAAALLGLELTIPGESGFDIDFSDQAIAANLTEASLGYVLTLTTTGTVTGEIGLQAYLAPANAPSLIASSYLLGGVQRVRLASGETRLERIVSLNAEQLRGISEGRLRLAIAVVEGTLSFSAAGQASITYALSSLTLTIGTVNAQVREKIPTAEGELLDFSEQELPFGRIVSLGFDYAVQLELDAVVTGKAKLQLYIAPADAADVFDPEYQFGKSQPLDLGQPVSSLEDRAELTGAQRDILRDKRLRFGILVTGEAGVTLGEPLRMSYRFTQLELFGGYAIN